MKSSLVSSMLPFLLVLLVVFPHMDTALGAQMESKLKETNHADQVTAQKIPNLRPFAHVLPHVLPHLIPGPPDRHGH